MTDSEIAQRAAGEILTDVAQIGLVAAAMTKLLQTQREQFDLRMDHTLRTLAATHIRAETAEARLASAVEALAEMEEGYRERCNYCGGSLTTCEELSPTAGCRAHKARAAIRALPNDGAAWER